MRICVRNKLFAAFAICLFGQLSTEVRGSMVLYDSLNSGFLGVFGLVSTEPYGPWAESFSTGSSQVELTDIQVALALYGSPVTGYGTTVSLYSDNGTTPGSLLANLGTIPDSSLPGSPTLTLATPYALNANTRYWIRLTEPPVPGNGGSAWYWTPSGSGTGVAGEYVMFNGTARSTSSFGSFGMRVTASSLPAPEPSTLVVAATGLAVGLAGLARKRLASARRTQENI